MDLQLQDKIVIITGGARGIGKAITEGLAEEHAIPVIIDKNDEALARLADGFKSRNIKHLALELDISKMENCQKAVEKTVRTFGKIDSLINNAGINIGLALHEDPAKFIPLLRKNLFHYYYMTHYCLEYLRESKGNILNISSKTAVTGQGGTSGYVASKGAQLALTREWAVELAPHEIRVNALLPAEVETPMYLQWINRFKNPDKKLKKITDLIPLGHRMTRPDEIANMALFLISERASHITGQHIFVDGGYVHLDRAAD